MSRGPWARVPRDEICRLCAPLQPHEGRGAVRGRKEGRSDGRRGEERRAVSLECRVPGQRRGGTEWGCAARPRLPVSRPSPPTDAICGPSRCRGSEDPRVHRLLPVRVDAAAPCARPLLTVPCAFSSVRGSAGGSPGPAAFLLFLSSVFDVSRTLTHAPRCSG